MKELGIDEAGTQFAALLALVEQGKEIRLTRDGAIVAELTPPRAVSERAARADKAFQEIRERAKAEGVQPVDAATIKEWIKEWRR